MKKWFFIFCVIRGFEVYAQDTLRISLLFTGDIMQHDSQISAAYQPSLGQHNYKPCFQFIKPALSSADLTIGNLELTLAGQPFKGFPQFSAPDELLDAIKDSGFDVLVTANNHSVDRGSQGLERTVDLLDSSGILHTGTFKDTLDWLNEYPLIIESKGFRFSLLNYTYGTNGLPVSSPNIVNRIDTMNIRRDLQKAKDQHTDAIIVFMHWGQEYQSLPNAWQKNLADYCFRQGAKMVIGSHPHVLQPIEWRQEQDQLVAYSLGNFVSGQRDRYRNGGALLYVDLEKITTPGGSEVAMKDVQYELEYVHRANDARKTYQILPVNQFENDSISIGKKAHELLIQFRDDAHTLFQKENRNVVEKRSIQKSFKNP